LIVQFSVVGENGVAPDRAHEHDAGYDLRAAEPAMLDPGQRTSVGTGIAVAIPPRHAGMVLPRSGLALRNGIALVNAPGLIDSGYRGELRVLLLNTDRDEAFAVEIGDRIAQLVITPVENVEFIATDDLDSSRRAAGGFGSTGVR